MKTRGFTQYDNLTHHCNCYLIKNDAGTCTHKSLVSYWSALVTWREQTLRLVQGHVLSERASNVCVIQCGIVCSDVNIWPGPVYVCVCVCVCVCVWLGSWTSLSSDSLFGFHLALLLCQIFRICWVVARSVLVMEPDWGNWCLCGFAVKKEETREV